MLFEAGAAEVHVRISSPPIVSPCFYGIDMATRRSSSPRPAPWRRSGSTSERRRSHYLSLDGMQQATQRPESAFCRACFTREYPTRVPETAALAKRRFEHITR